MYNIIQIQDRLKDVSDDYLKGLAARPSEEVPPFLVLSELKRRSDIQKTQEMRQAQDMSTVLEDQVAMQGMPVEQGTAMAQAMSPNTDTSRNAGRDEGLMAMKRSDRIPSEVMSVEDEDVRGMSYGGLVNSRAMVMAQPLRSTQPLRSSPPLARPFPFGIQQQRDNLGFKNLGSNIVNRIGEKSQGEVDEFIGEVRDMADERFDLDLNQQPQFDTGGKGFSPLLSSAQQANRGTPISPSMMYRREGGLVSMRNGGLLERVPPRPDDTGKFEGLMGKLIGPSRGSLDLASKWDEQFAMYYNPDGTIKEQYKNLVGSPVGQPATDPDDQLPSVKDSQRMMDINEIPGSTRKTTDPDPDKDDPAPTSYLDDIKRSLEEMREEAKEQYKKDEGLALIQAGLAMSKRGDISDATEGVKTLSAQRKAFQDRELQSRGLGVKIGVAEAQILQRDRTAAASLAKALGKGSLTNKEVITNYRQYVKDSADIEKQLNDLANPLSDEKRAELEERKKIFDEVIDMLGAKASGILGKDVISI